MNRPTQPRSKIACPLALMLSVGLAACGAQDGDEAFSDIALPRFAKDRVAREAPVEVRRMFSRDENLDFQALDVSPDGRYVTDILWGTGDLAVRELATGETRRVTNNGGNGGFPEASVFSPDGARIAYVWTKVPDETGPERSFDLRTIGIDGTDMKVHLSVDAETGYQSPEDWSKDGRYILITLWVENESQIVTLDVATNEIRVLKTEGQGPAFFSPDGRFVAFGAGDIFLVSSDGSQETALIQTPDHEELLGWLPDGSGILFHRSADDSRAIWKLPLRDGRPVGPPELVKDDVWQMTGFGFSEDAFFYGVTVSNPQVHVASIDPETGRVLEGMAPVAEVSGPPTRRGGWSADGLRLAYLEVDADETRIIVRSVTGELLQELTFPLSLVRGSAVRWSAHGLLVEGRDNRVLGRRFIYLLSLETGEMRPVRLAVGSRAPTLTVSEDGSRIFVNRTRGEPIIEHDLATGTERTLVDREAQVQSFFPDRPEAAIVTSSVSPDGDNIAYAVQPSGGDDGWAIETIEIFSRSSGNLRATARLARTQNDVRSSLVWSPDSRYLFFVGRLEEDEGTGYYPMRLSAEDGSVRSFPAIFGAAGGAELGPVSLSSDGRHITFVAGETRLEIWRMTFNGGG